MKTTQLATFAVALLHLLAVGHAQNDDCAQAAPLALGATPFDTTGAQSSPPLWPCANAGADLWFRFTPTSAWDLQVETCGSLFDTVLEVFSGTCGALTSLACNDDYCGQRSGLILTNLVPGTEYYLRVGGFGGSTGAGEILLSELTPPMCPPPLCVDTLFASDGQGAVGGAVYFDLTANQGLTLLGVRLNTASTDSGLGVDLYTTPGSSIGKESDPSAWTLVRRGAMTGVGQGIDQMTYLGFVTQVTLPAGAHGVALVAHGFGHSYTLGTGSNQSFGTLGGEFTVQLGAASDAPFGPGTLQPIVWNGGFCDNDCIWWQLYCQGNANSTGFVGLMGIGGSNLVQANNLVLEASSLPPNTFGFFLTSRTQAFVAQPNGSAGNLCLGGAIGRYVAPGQVWNSGAPGVVSLAIDNTQHPTPTGLAQVYAGERWNFQAWFRDAAGGAATSNFTNGASVLFF